MSELTIEQRLERLERSVNREIEWEESSTQSGIEIQGPTRVTRRGTLISAVPQVVGNGVVVMCVVRNDVGEVGVITGPFRFVDNKE